MQTDEQLKEKLTNMPMIETSTRLSGDGKWVIEKVTITSLKPVTYYRKMLNPDLNKMFHSANKT